MPRKHIAKSSLKAGVLKRGRLSADELRYIHENVEKQTAEQIAKKLQRDIKQISREIDGIKGARPQTSASLEVQLQSRPEWRQFCKQFTFDELEEFKHQYVQIMSQMKDDVMATEELQVFQVITLKIEIDRTLATQKMALDDMNEAHADIVKLRQEYKKTGSQQVREDLLLAETRYNEAKLTNKECAEQYKLYSDKQDRMFSALKATREQRVKTLENSRQSMVGWLKLLLDEETRTQLGNEMEMMKIASQKERERLSKDHVYADGTTDKPLLSAETIVNDDDSD